jgi:NADPH-dependent 2,4-dienoyl-CoA reductase/sulfur reductase-like enzyme
MRPAPGSTEAEYEALLKDYQRDLSKAKKVVVVGGGAAGTEVAGVSTSHYSIMYVTDDSGPIVQEIKHQFPSIDVTIVHSQSQILNPATKGLTPATNRDPKSKSWSAAPTPSKFSPPIEKKLKELKINLILNEKVQIPQSKTGIAVGEWDGSFGFQGQIKKLRLSSGKSIEADFVFLSVGNQANGSIVEKADSGAIVNGMGKMVDVDDYLKVSLHSTKEESD